MIKKFFKIIFILLLSLTAVISILLIKNYIDSFHIKVSWGYDYQNIDELQNMDIDFIYDNKKINFKNPIYVKDSCVFAEIEDLSEFIGFNYHYHHPLINIIGSGSDLIFEKDNERIRYPFSQKSSKNNYNMLYIYPLIGSAYNEGLSEAPFVISKNLVYFPVCDILELFDYSIEDWNNSQIIIKTVNERIFSRRLTALKGINIKYNDKEIVFSKIRPIFIGYVIYFPVKELFEAMGYKVVWLNNGSPSKLGVGKDNTGLLITKDNELYFLPKDDKNINVNRNIRFDEYFEPKIIDGTYMISYEYINRLTGKYVYRKKKGLYLYSTIYISDKEKYELERYDGYVEIKDGYVWD